MMIHPIFPNIVMHNDHELADLLGVNIVNRKTIHEWSLSCVQLICLDDGSKMVYKAQLPPTVEPLFYENAISRLLPDYHVYGKIGNCYIMTIDWIDAPLLSKTVRSENKVIEHAKQIISQIGEIAGNLPTYLNIGSYEAWLGLGEVMLEKLRKLIIDRRFRSVDLDKVERVRGWAKSSIVIEKVTSSPRVVHGDLKADQVFITNDGYRIIDW
ncbi:MAG TPA: hypothetical protein VF941_21300, partial [Clostridia bacterium]